MKLLNWLLYEVHRWLGVVLALFMFVWFFSGLVIMYTAPATQSRSQLLAHAESLQPESGWLSLGDAWERSAAQRNAAAEARKARVSSGGEQMQMNAAGEKKAKEGPAGIAEARLLRITGQPYWLVEDTRNQRFALSATDGSLHETSAEQALEIAQNWYKTSAGTDAVKVSHLELIESPIFLRNQENLRPFHHVAVGEGGDELYISAKTGEVIHASSQLDRAFWYAGNWIHLFKPLDALGWGSIRHDVQVWSGFTATIACLTGLIIGWLRWRPGFNGKKTYSEGRTQPYREFWFKWHFWSGLLGGTVALFWAFSGYLSTNPWKIFAQDYSREEYVRYLGNELPDAMRNWQPAPLADSAGGADVVELAWRRLGGEAVLIAYGRSGQRLPQIAESSLQPQFSEAALLSGVKRVAANSEVESQTVLNDYDSYYYPRHHQGLVEKPLPVVQVKLADAAGTLIYLDPQDGRLLSKLDQSRRVFRWLYSALHHWDFGWLYYRPIWDAWMLIWVAFGLVLGGTSLVIGWKRLKKTFAPKKKLAVRGSPITGKLATENATE